MIRVILGLLGSLTLGHPDYEVRHGSFRALSCHPYLAASVSVAAWYHPDKEVNHTSRRLWNPRLSDCFFLTRKTEADTIPEEVKDAAERLGLLGEWDDIGWFYPNNPDYADRLEVKSKLLMALPITITPR